MPGLQLIRTDFVTGCQLRIDVRFGTGKGLSRQLIEFIKDRDHFLRAMLEMRSCST